MGHTEQFIELVLRGLPITADAEIEGVASGGGSFHSVPPSVTIAAPSKTTITTITWMGGRSCQRVSEAVKPKRRPSQNERWRITATSESVDRRRHANAIA